MHYPSLLQHTIISSLPKTAYSLQFLHKPSTPSIPKQHHRNLPFRNTQPSSQPTTFATVNQSTSLHLHLFLSKPSFNPLTLPSPSYSCKPPPVPVLLAQSSHLNSANP
ncbi:hypothetical protein RYX36_030826 [Vicia faba]